MCKRWAKKIITFGNIEIEKHEFCRHKNLIILNDTDNLFISKKFLPVGKIINASLVS